MYHVKNWKILFFVCITYSCASLKLPSTYVSERNKIGPDAFEINLKTDSTFVFVGWSDVLGEEKVKGKWFLRKDTLYLKASQRNELPYIKVTEVKRSDLTGIRIKLLDENSNEPLTGAEIYVNDNNKPFILGFEDEIIIEKQQVERLKIKYLEINEFIKINNPSANDFTIHINLKNKKLDKFYLSEKWLVKGKSIYPINNKNQVLNGEKFIKK